MATSLPLDPLAKRRSPDSKHVVGMMGNQFFCYDVDEDEAKTIPLSRSSGIGDFQWLGNDRCLGLAGGKGVVLYDRLSNAFSEIAALPFPCFRISEPSPDGRFVFCAGGINGRNGALVDVEKKTAVAINGGAGIAWVSNDTFAFSREVPDSDLRGTWLQTAGQAERRVSPEPYLVINDGAQLLAPLSMSLVIYATKHGLAKMKSDGKEGAQLFESARPNFRLITVQGWRVE